MSKASSTEGRIPAAFQGLKVVDIDTHFTEPKDLWTSRVPARLRERVPHVRRVGDTDQWFVNDTPMGPVSYTVISSGGEKRHGILTLSRYDEVDPSSFDARARLRLMDEMGIWAQIVFPNAGGFGAGKLASLMPEEDRNLCVRVYNDAVAEWQSAGDGRLLPQAVVPFWNIRGAVAEVRRAKESLGLRGIAATSEPEAWDGQVDYGDPAWDPFWEVCSELEMPISFHIASGDNDGQRFWRSFAPGTKDYPALLRHQGSRKMAPIGAAAVMYSLSNARLLANLIYSGVLDRWPKLKFVSVESGLGWIPFFLEMIDYQLDEMSDRDRWGLQLRPREYFRRHMYASWWFEEFGPRHAIEEVGVNNVLFETDFPHPTCLYPDPLRHAARVLENASAHVRRRVMQDNAAELWKIPIASSSTC